MIDVYVDDIVLVGKADERMAKKTLATQFEVENNDQLH